MRADRDFKTYEQALTIVQRFGDLAEADHTSGKYADAQYNLSRATFVGVKHLLFMAADAAVDRAEARELAAKNHLATIELMSLTLAALADASTERNDAADVGSQVGSYNPAPGAKAVKGQRAATSPAAPKPALAGKRSNSGASEKKRDVKRPL